jgi:hypothetical protein
MMHSASEITVKNLTQSGSPGEMKIAYLMFPLHSARVDISLSRFPRQFLQGSRKKSIRAQRLLHWILEVRAPMGRGEVGFLESFPHPFSMINSP